MESLTTINVFVDCNCHKKQCKTLLLLANGAKKNTHTNVYFSFIFRKYKSNNLLSSVNKSMRRSGI